MNTVISRAFAKIASPSPTLSAQKWQHYASLFLQSYTYATTATSKTPRQSKRRGGAESSKSKSESTAEVEAATATAATNSVNVIGYVHVPVQFEASPDGKCWAGTVLAQTHQISSPPSSPDSPSLRIPIIFEGNLAHIAACHLKEKNFVHVTGRLSADPPHLNANQGQANIQVMVHSLNFVQPSFQMKNSSTSSEKKWSLKRLASVKNEDDISQSWKLVSQSNLRDIRIIQKLQHLNRRKMMTMTLKPGSPDFTHKDRCYPLWLTDAPSWVLSELDRVEFDVKTQKPKQVKQHRGEESWKDLVQNPTKWWDNRLNKRNQRAPDFKHKDTGEGLWLNGSPDWVLPKLPPLKGDKV
ncbi:hypothetical protein ACB098_08G145200 [Castanea mollissima]